MPPAQPATGGNTRRRGNRRRCVEIALAEFGNLSSRAIAGLCGVGDQLVRAIRPEDQVRESRTSTVTGTDGRQYPAARKPSTNRQQTPPDKKPRSSPDVQVWQAIALNLLTIVDNLAAKMR